MTTTVFLYKFLTSKDFRTRMRLAANPQMTFKDAWLSKQFERKYCKDNPFIEDRR